MSLALVVSNARSAEPLHSLAGCLPADFVRDGSVSYQDEIQRAIDSAAAAGETLLFPGGTYAVDERGWQLHTGSRLHLANAVFQVRAEATADGAVFHGDHVTDVELNGGAIVGRNDVWPDGVNVPRSDYHGRIGADSHRGPAGAGLE